MTDTPFLIKLPAASAAETIASIGADKSSLPIFNEKSEILPIKITDIRTPAANIIKQELLSAGGDAVTPRGCVNCAVPTCSILMLSTVRQYRRLLTKIAAMPYFGLPEIARQLEEILKHIAPAADSQPAAAPVTTLADGRTITYEQIAVMGIINVTPDSFFSGSRVNDEELLIATAEKMLQEGAAILDLGAESTRPGSASIDGEEERRRLIPAVKLIHEHFPEAIISVDTYRADTAREALAAGAHIINDISAMEKDPNMADFAAESGAPIILMHMRGTPADMMNAENTQYDDITDYVTKYLVDRAAILTQRGIGKDKIILDPGIGFAKNTEQNLTLMRNLTSLTAYGYPVLLAASRKTVIGQTLGGLPPEDRLEGTIATSCAAVYAGAHMVRVHDVAANLRAIRVTEAILKK
ncbi:MAG: dihydropteroate synthase [Selenomonadaceae bacterium]|nr:dihydropteroate synthase [Selenomonadaceae bacterium]